MLRLFQRRWPYALPVLLLVASLAREARAQAEPAEEPPVPAELQPVPFDSVTTARYRAVASKLAAAVGENDARAFRALHSEAGWERADDWWKAMMANQRRSFGRVMSVRGPVRGVVRAGGIGVGVPPEGMGVLVLFERGAGAVMNFVLDQEGLIERSNLWVQRELAEARPEGADSLWQDPKARKRP
jgi:hypothetical protein